MANLDVLVFNEVGKVIRHLTFNPSANDQSQQKVFLRVHPSRKSCDTTMVRAQGLEPTLRRSGT